MVLQKPQLFFLASTCTLNVPPAAIVGLVIFILKINGSLLVRLVVQLRLPVASYNKRISLPSLPLLFAGPAAIVKSRRGSIVPALTAASFTIWVSWLETFPPLFILLFSVHGSEGGVEPGGYKV